MQCLDGLLLQLHLGSLGLEAAVADAGRHGWVARCWELFDC